MKSCAVVRVAAAMATMVALPSTAHAHAGNNAQSVIALQPVGAELPAFHPIRITVLILNP